MGGLVLKKWEVNRPPVRRGIAKIVSTDRFDCGMVIARIIFAMDRGTSKMEQRQTIRLPDLPVFAPEGSLRDESVRVLYGRTWRSHTSNLDLLVQTVADHGIRAERFDTLKFFLDIRFNHR